MPRENPSTHQSKRFTGPLLVPLKFPVSIFMSRVPRRFGAIRGSKRGELPSVWGDSREVGGRIRYRFRVGFQTALKFISAINAITYDFRRPDSQTQTRFSALSLPSAPAFSDLPSRFGCVDCWSVRCRLCVDCVLVYGRLYVGLVPVVCRFRVGFKQPNVTPPFCKTIKDNWLRKSAPAKPTRNTFFAHVRAHKQHPIPLMNPVRRSVTPPALSSSPPPLSFSNECRNSNLL